MSMIFPRVALTGHRPQSLSPSARDWVPLELERLAVKLRDQHGMRVGISGMALGSDIWWAQATVFAWLDLWAFIPFPQQADPARWKPADVALWNEMRSRAAAEVVIAPEYSVQALFARNEAMLNDADLVIAVWNPWSTGGGTTATVKSAVNRGLPIIHLDPDRQTTTLLAPGRMPS
ncbi:DprA-like DNA processing chain A [Microbacterium phage Rudy]|nr:DprA-like DNA processing chain A [Microbacterium phage Rudy]QWY80497.1 DprA-like DNA processing chain A [Microbacterium phage Quammi]UVG33854.1 DprA-like DNA processing chain A [Microbacterium phage Viceroy]